MPTPLLSFLFVVLFVASRVGAAEPLDAVHHAQALLGPDTWTQVLEIENTNKRSAYPKRTYALVFELNRILWIYTPHDGTQSLSLTVNTVTRDRDALLPLLQAIEPGFVRITPLPPARRWMNAWSEPLPNGCFVESVVAWRGEIQKGVPILQASLLMYYAKVNGQIHGHTVLAFETPEGVFVIDRINRRRERVSESWSSEPLTLARATAPDLRRKLSTARYLPLDEQGPLPARNPAHEMVAQETGKSTVTPG